MHDPRVGRFFAVDPLFRKFPWNSSYAFSENRVIDWGELEGREGVTEVLGGIGVIALTGYTLYQSHKVGQSASLRQAFNQSVTSVVNTISEAYHSLTETLPIDDEERKAQVYREGIPASTPELANEEIIIPNEIEEQSPIRSGPEKAPIEEAAPIIETIPPAIEGNPHIKILNSDTSSDDKLSTPSNAPEKFDNRKIDGGKYKVNKETGEVFQKNKASHPSENWNMWNSVKNLKKALKKNSSQPTRDAKVWPDGTIHK